MPSGKKKRFRDARGSTTQGADFVQANDLEEAARGMNNINFRKRQERIAARRAKSPRFAPTLPKLNLPE